MRPCILCTGMRVRSAERALLSRYGLSRRKATERTLTLTTSDAAMDMRGVLLSASDGTVYSITAQDGSRLTAQPVSRWRRLWWWICGLLEYLQSA
jgi:hypothetical protein